jgi:hypothetical protein
MVYAGSVLPKLVKRALAESLLLFDNYVDLSTLLLKFNEEPTYAARLRNVSDELVKSLVVIGESRGEAEKYAKDTGLRFSAKVTRTEAGHVLRLLEAFGAGVTVTRAASSALKDSQLRKQLSFDYLFSNIKDAEGAVNALMYNATTSKTSSQVNWKKITVGLSFILLALPIIFLSLVYDTSYGSAGVVVGGGLSASGAKTIQEALAS